MAHVHHIVQIIPSKNVTLSTTCERLATQHHFLFLRGARDVYRPYTDIAPWSVLIMVAEAPPVDSGGLFSRVP